MAECCNLNDVIVSDVTTLLLSSFAIRNIHTNSTENTQ